LIYKCFASVIVVTIITMTTTTINITILTWLVLLGYFTPYKGEWIVNLKDPVQPVPMAGIHGDYLHAYYTKPHIPYHRKALLATHYLTNSMELSPS
jgi:hypothetical protein